MTFARISLALGVLGLPFVASAFEFVLPAGENAVSLPFLYESERGDPDGLLLSDRPVMLRLGWDDAALSVAVEAGDEVLPDDGLRVKVADKAFDFALEGKKSFSAKIPWADAGVKAEEGAKVRLDVERTRAKGVPGADRLSVSTATLSRTASSWGFSNPIHLGDKWFDTTFSLTARKAGKARVSFNVYGRRPLNFYVNTPLSAKAGETKAVPMKGGSMDRGSLDLRVFDTDGTRLFANTWKFRANEPVAVRVIRTDLANERLLLETDNRVGPDDGYRVKLTMTDFFDASKTVWEKTVPATVARGVTNEVFDVSDLKPGVYKAVSTILTKDGSAVRQYVNYYAKEDGKPAWLDAGLGEEDEVPPPWTPPVSTDDSFACWGREHRLGGDGLMSAMKTQGREILAGPVAVVLNGRRLPFVSKVLRRRNAGTDYTLTSSGSGVAATLGAEFDGFFWFELDWGNVAERVESLDVVMPLRRETLAGLEVGPNGYFRVLGATNSVWKVDPTQYPCWWIGDGRTGFMAGLPFVRGTHLKNVRNAVEIKVGPGGAELVMHLVDTPLKPSGERKVGFYLEATPSHPRNNACALVPREKVAFWTGQVAHFFDASMEGMMDEKRCAAFRRRQREEGASVFYYYSVKGTSPYQPWWGRFGQSWTRFNDPANWYNECKTKPGGDEQTSRERGNWVRTCLADKNFADHKVWTIDWFLKSPKYEAMNLYFDLAQPGFCSTEGHGCVWTDDFGVKRSRWDVKEMRETNLRAYRLLKRKNPNGVIFGHSGTFRGPSDVFFDRMVRGEHYAGAVNAAGETYYGVLNPEDMQVKYASRSNEYVIDMLPQIVRAMQMYGKGWKLKTYDPLEPEADRAIRHATAYFKIHDLLVATAVDGRRDGPQWQVAEQCIADLGATRAFKAYYHPDCPVTVDRPDRLFLYAWYHGGGQTLVIVLNDTDETVTKTLAVKGLSGVGRDLFKGGEADFANGRHTVTLGPRESRFWLFR